MRELDFAFQLMYNHNYYNGGVFGFIENHFCVWAFGKLPLWIEHQIFI